MKKSIIALLLVLALTCNVCFGSEVDNTDRASENIANVIAGCFHIGFGVWGLKQDTTFGNWAGTLFLIRGAGNLISVRF